MRHYKDLLTCLNDYPIEWVTNNKKVRYANIAAGFDIETTSIVADSEKFAAMYIWQIGIGHGNPIYFGRTWNEFLDCLEMLSDFLELDNNNRLIIYVHNLGYEFQFMRKYFNFLDVFSVDERKPIKALTDLGIEFRCSYILSGYSLANTAKNLVNYKVEKLIGDLDYSLPRHHKTRLTKSELEYCENDVLIVVAYIQEQIDQYKGIIHIPTTNTGRVRTYVRNRCYYLKSNGSKAGKGQYLRYRDIMADLTLDGDTYLQLKRAFMGGFTHSNPNHTGKVLNNVTSIDFTSSYPSVMVAELFPMSSFTKAEINSLAAFNELKKRYCLLLDIKLVNVTPKIEQESYISESKCFELSGATVTNGRIYKADSLAMTVTEIDLDIINQCYNYDDIYISNAKKAAKGYLPKSIIMAILNLYQDKTVLKDVQGKEVEYLLSKGMLNSIYGMSVTDVLKDKATYLEDNWGVEKADFADGITKYNNSKNRFLYYAWGIWVTAYARRNLWTGIIATGNDYVYSDTDSLKLLNYDKHQKYIEWFNKNMIEKMKATCHHYKLWEGLLNPKTQKGVEKMLGVWDYEGTYSRFKTLGAKRYLIQNGDKIQLTVAGLSKQNGVEYMLEQSGIDGVFDYFDNDLYIPANRTGKMTHSYIDNANSAIITDHLGQSEMVHTLSAIHLEPCDFTLSVSNQFSEFLKQLKAGFIFKGNKYE